MSRFVHTRITLAASLFTQWSTSANHFPIVM